MKYEPKIQSARLMVVGSAALGGRLELLDAEGARLAFVTLGTYELPKPDLLEFVGFPMFGAAERAGEVRSARVVDSAGEGVIKALVVGLKGAEVTIDKLQVEKDNVIKIESLRIRHP